MITATGQGHDRRHGVAMECEGGIPAVVGTVPAPHVYCMGAIGRNIRSPGGVAGGAGADVMGGCRRRPAVPGPCPGGVQQVEIIAHGALDPVVGFIPWTVGDRSVFGGNRYRGGRGVFIIVQGKIVVPGIIPHFLIGIHIAGGVIPAGGPYILRRGAPTVGDVAACPVDAVTVITFAAPVVISPGIAEVGAHTHKNIIILSTGTVGAVPVVGIG